MKVSTLIHWLVLVLCGAHAASSAAQAISATSIYSNDAVGVQVDLGSDWQLYTSREAAPEALRQHFPPAKGPDESPLYIGMHSGQALFSRLLVETFFDDLEAYVRQLADTLAQQGLELEQARILPDGSAAEVQYVQRSLGLHFIERLSPLADGQVLRMGFWTGRIERGTFTDVIETAFDAARVRGVRGQPEGYRTIWAGLDSRLPRENLAGLAALDGTPDTSAELVCADPTASMLWEVKGAELDGRGITMHLFGSIHVGKPEFYPLHPMIETQFRSADKLVFEVDPRVVQDPQTAVQMQMRGMLPAGQTLTDIVSQQSLAELQKILAGFGIPLNSLMNLKPWLLALMLANFRASALGYNAEFGLESYFITQRSPDSEIRELESLEQQVATLDSLDHEIFLDYSLEEYDRSGKELDRMVEAWRCGDKEALAQAVFANMQPAEGLDEDTRTGLEALNRAMFAERNERMAAGIEQSIRTGTGSWFVVVGSGHLLGEDSVVELLKRRGYEVEPVRLAP